jgi:hypothetical protein
MFELAASRGHFRESEANETSLTAFILQKVNDSAVFIILLDITQILARAFAPSRECLVYSTDIASLISCISQFHSKKSLRAAAAGCGRRRSDSWVVHRLFLCLLEEPHLIPLERMAISGSKKTPLIAREGMAILPGENQSTKNGPEGG